MFNVVRILSILFGTFIAFHLTAVEGLADAGYPIHISALITPWCSARSQCEQTPAAGVTVRIERLRRNGESTESFDFVTNDFGYVLTSLEKRGTYRAQIISPRRYSRQPLAAAIFKIRSNGSYGDHSAVPTSILLQLDSGLR